MTQFYGGPLDGSNSDESFCSGKFYLFDSEYDNFKTFSVYQYIDTKLVFVESKTHDKLSLTGEVRTDGP